MGSGPSRQSIACCCAGQSGSCCCCNLGVAATILAILSVLLGFAGGICGLFAIGEYLSYTERYEILQHTVTYDIWRADLLVTIFSLITGGILCLVFGLIGVISIYTLSSTLAKVAGWGLFADGVIGIIVAIMAWIVAVPIFSIQSTETDNHIIWLVLNTISSLFMISIGISVLNVFLSLANVIEVGGTGWENMSANELKREDEEAALTAQPPAEGAVPLPSSDQPPAYDESAYVVDGEAENT
eukprot:GHVU01135999.1.p1 GENE.GHVU01135999.1~~GHVU01135999.1.p1  ORF type:complete len:242 (-),score=7.97 GHVU01135999.1:754-1479(-)